MLDSKTSRLCHSVECTSRRSSFSSYFHMKYILEILTAGWEWAKRFKWQNEHSTTQLKSTVAQHWLRHKNWPTMNETGKWTAKTKRMARIKGISDPQKPIIVWSPCKHNNLSNKIHFVFTPHNYRNFRNSVFRLSQRAQHTKLNYLCFCFGLSFFVFCITLQSIACVHSIFFIDKKNPCLNTKNWQTARRIYWTTNIFFWSEELFSFVFVKYICSFIW